MALALLASCILGARGQAVGYDYQQYISGGAGGAPGQPGGFDYSKYTKGGGGYSQYMQGGGANYQQYMQGGGASFDYSQYMDMQNRNYSQNSNYSQYNDGAAAFDYSQYMPGGGVAFDYSQYLKMQNGNYSQDDGNASNYSQDMGGNGNYSQDMQFNYSQYMGGGGYDYSKYIPGGGGASNGGGYDYSKYIPGGGGASNHSQYGGDYYDYSQYTPGNGGAGDYSRYVGGGGFDYSQYILGGAGAGFNYSQYMQGYGPGASSGDYQRYIDQYVPGGDKPDREERLAIAKADASHKLQQLKMLLDQVSNASADAEEQDVRQHMFASLTDGERDASARWQRLRGELHDLHEQFQREGANWSQEERSEAARHAEHLDGNLTHLEEQLRNATSRAERFVSGFIKQRAQSDEKKADSLARQAGLQCMEWEGLAKSVGNREEERSARDADKTAQDLARDVGDAAERLARSVEALASKSEETVRQNFRNDQARRRAEVREMQPAEDEPTLGAPDASALAAASAPRSTALPGLPTALLLFAPVLIALLFVRLRRRRAGDVEEIAMVDAGSELPYHGLA